MSYSVSYTKKGPGRVNQVSLGKKFGVRRKATSKLATKQVKHTVGLKNAVVSLVQAHFDEKSKERFLASHN